MYAFELAIDPLEVTGFLLCMFNVKLGKIFLTTAISMKQVLFYISLVYTQVCLTYSFNSEIFQTIHVHYYNVTTEYTMTGINIPMTEHTTNTGVIMLSKISIFLGQVGSVQYTCY